jgi:hypothetical protein
MLTVNPVLREWVSESFRIPLVFVVPRRGCARPRASPHSPLRFPKALRNEEGAWQATSALSTMGRLEPIRGGFYSDLRPCNLGCLTNPDSSSNFFCPFCASERSDALVGTNGKERGVTGGLRMLPRLRCWGGIWQASFKQGGSHSIIKYLQ